MRRLLPVLFLLIAADIAVDASPATAQPFCMSIVKAVERARASKNLDRLSQLFASANDRASGCEPKAVLCIGQSVALGYVQAAYDQTNAGAKLGEVAETLQHGRKFAVPWQLLVAQGDIEAARGHAGKISAYTEAARAYALAYNALMAEAQMAEAHRSPCWEYGEAPPPTRDQIAFLHKKMVEATLVAPRFDLVPTREGECGGVFVQSVRGFTPTRTALPVEFKYNSTQFTEKGLEAATALRECVHPYKSIRLSGHTDKVGSDAFNMELSKERLDKLKDFLIKGQNGFKGDVELEPKGKREPFVVSDPTQYTEAQIDQMNRRVELKEVIKK